MRADILAEYQKLSDDDRQKVDALILEFAKQDAKKDTATEAQPDESPRLVFVKPEPRPPVKYNLVNKESD